MSGRGATAAVIDELAKDQIRVCHLVSVGLDSGTVYMSSGYKDVVWSGNTYVAVGHFLGFDRIEETSKIELNETNLALSGVDQTWISAVLGEDYLDRQVIIMMAFFDTNDAIISDPLLIFDGRVNGCTVTNNPDPGDGSSVVTLSVVNAWVDFDRSPGRRTNHQEQQSWFSGDLGFEFASEITKPIRWGMPGSSS